MEDLCVKLFNSWRLKIDFLFSLRVSALRLEPRSHYLFFCRREGYMESPGNEVASFMTALILLKPAIIVVSVNKKIARSWARKC